VSKAPIELAPYFDMEELRRLAKLVPAVSDAKQGILSQIERLAHEDYQTVTMSWIGAIVIVMMYLKRSDQEKYADGMEVTVSLFFSILRLITKKG
jgi:hypothetical protein